MSDTSGWKGRRAETPGAMGKVVDILRDLRRRVAALEVRAVLNAASISSGGLRIKDGGDVTVQDGGQLQVVGDEGERIRFHDGSMFLRYDAGNIEGRVTAGTSMSGQPAVWVIPPADVARTRETENAVIVVGRDATSPGGLLLGTEGQLQATAAQDMLFDAAGTMFFAADGDVVLQPADGHTVWAHLETNTGTANVLYGGATTGIGALWKTGSSLRYKQDVEDLDLSHLSADQIVDALHGRTWRDRGQVGRDPDTTERIPGHIAEEIHDAGLTAFVIYDDQGRPDGVAYDRLSGALAQALRTTRDELAVERGRIDSLEEAVTALTAPTTPDPEEVSS